MQNSKPSLYDVLGIQSSATNDQVKTAFRELALKFHPDKLSNPTAEDTEKFGCIKEAYDILRDENQRRRYDAELNFMPHAEQTAEKPRHHIPESQSSILTRQIKQAIETANIVQLDCLYATYVSQQLNLEKEYLNMQLRIAAKNKHNQLALTLIKFGADLDHYSSVLSNISAYFLDMLIEWNNFELFSLIGMREFNLNIYFVSQHFSNNLLNKLVNLKDYEPRPHINYTSELEDVLVNIFLYNCSVRQIWLAKFCRWLISNNCTAVLDQIEADFNNKSILEHRGKYYASLIPESRPDPNNRFSILSRKFTSLSIIESFQTALENQSSSSLKRDLQYMVDLKINYALSNLIYSKQEFDQLKILLGQNTRLLKTAQWHHEHRKLIMFALLVFGSIGLVLACAGLLNIYTENNGIINNKDLTLIITGTLFALYMEVVLFKLTIGIMLRIASCGNIEISNGYTLPVRAYVYECSSFCGFLYNVKSNQPANTSRPTVSMV